MNKKYEPIKMVALDLDGTTLDMHGNLTNRTRQVLEKVLAKNLQVVIATGRVFSALPASIRSIWGIEYAITSNGASVVKFPEGKPIYTNLLASEVVEQMISLFNGQPDMLEAFVNGRAYIDWEEYYRVERDGSPFDNTEYLLSTREPVRNLTSFILEHKDCVENINVNIVSPQRRQKIWADLEKISTIEVTSSFDYNLEICSPTASKADGLRYLCPLLGILPEEIMAFGDSHNDIEMLKFVGFPVTVENAKEEVKAIANYIAPANHEEGVAEVLEMLLDRV